MKNKGIKKTFGILIAITLVAGMMTGCGEKRLKKWNRKQVCMSRRKLLRI